MSNTAGEIPRKNDSTQIAGNYVDSSVYHPERPGTTRIAKEIFAQEIRLEQYLHLRL